MLPGTVSTHLESVCSGTSQTPKMPHLVDSELEALVTAHPARGQKDVLAKSPVWLRLVVDVLGKKEALAAS